ncbi:MAG: PASTA domain-containing protein [Acholeplasmataceae bacterium]|jgi:endonuclease YncB( thermonuclease family)|nr:PASTA domain-containing protein [Acholeplasmataceae bacterium]
MRKLIPILFLLLFITACQQDLLLPDLSGKTETEAVQVIEDLGLTPVLAYETDVTVTHGSFIRYEIGFVAGKKVEKGDEITLYIAKNGVILPDLSELTETEVVTQLDALDIDYTIAYEHKYSNDDYEFSRFLDLEAGELLPYDQELTVYITWNGALLPDVTNMLKYEIIDALEYDFIQNYTFEYIVNDDYEEDMFAGYKDLEIGYPAPDDGTITIYLYKNTFTDEDDITLFISKYLMGEANSRAIEIYNPTDAAIDLADYHIALFTNGAMTPSSIVQLEGILASHDTYVLAYRGSSQAVIDKADQQTNLLMFDGNDTIQLRYKNNTYIDTIYEIGNQLFVMVGEHFIRNSSVTGGTRTFKLNEWDAYIPSYVAPLGTHPIQKPETIEINLTYLNNTWGSTTASGMVLVTLSGINDGDTASFSPGFEGDARVRFLGVDTPETYPVADPWGPEAKAYTTSVLTQPGATIYIQSDPYLGATETYGRSLGYVWVNGLLLNYDLIRHGYSYNYLSNDTKLVYGNRYLYRWFQDAERYARENSLGIHSS